MLHEHNTGNWLNRPPPTTGRAKPVWVFRGASGSNPNASDTLGGCRNDGCDSTKHAAISETFAHGARSRLKSHGCRTINALGLALLLGLVGLAVITALEIADIGLDISMEIGRLLLNVPDTGGAQLTETLS